MQRFNQVYYAYYANYAITALTYKYCMLEGEVTVLLLQGSACDKKQSTSLLMCVFENESTYILRIRLPLPKPSRGKFPLQLFL